MSKKDREFGKITPFFCLDLFDYYASCRMILNQVPRIFIATIISLLCIKAFAQPSEIDSLKELLTQHTTTDTIRISYLNSLAEQLKNIDLEQSIKHAREAESLSSSIGYARGEMFSQIVMAHYYKKKSDWPNTLRFLEEALNTASNLNDKTALFECNSQLGVIYEFKGQYDTSLHYYKKALKIAEDVGDKSGVSECYNNLGIISRFQGNNPGALEYYQKSLEIAMQIEDQEGISVSYNNIGIIYYYMEDYPNALEYYQKSLNLDIERDDQSGVSKCYNNIAIILNKQGKFDEALSYYQKSLNIKKELDDKMGMAHSYMNIADNYYSQGSFSEALEYFQKSLELSESIEFQSNIVGSYIGLAKTHYQLGQYEMATAFGERGYSLASELGKMEYLKDGAEVLSNVYFSTGQYKKAYSYQVEFKNRSDQLLNKENIKKITNLEAQFQFEKERQQIVYEQKKQSEIQTAEVANQKTIRNLFVVGFMLAVVALTVVIKSFYEKRKALKLLAEKNQIIEQSNVELENKNDELEIAFREVRLQKEEIEKINASLTKANETKVKFLKIISHDLRSPITSWVGLVHLLKQSHLENEDMDDLIVLIEKNANGVLKLVDNLLEWAWAQSESTPFYPENLEVKNLFRDVLSDLESSATNKQINLTTEDPNSTTIYGDKNMIRSVIRNLVSNGIKFTNKGGSVAITAKSENKSTVISVRDTGIGMSKKSLDELFNDEKTVSTPGTNDEMGTGFGFMICKEFIQKHNGKIWAESEEGIGTTFKFSLPDQSTAA
ncbi:tetratricopeptide repeat-containing sensor histidine kinase [Marinoscillum sp. MHG1-6]|uniref:tetratricopeptide repeat-containing sensor histidine kinase n=1 Tax=Marinoscillum sp. MHG1-6 TaxID=2959627 RepID=UPI002156FDA8|nr:tetratricopeptide repeat-containing sensor histidine kinase [Marinoscillum sp. MHG1-6]